MSADLFSLSLSLCLPLALLSFSLKAGAVPPDCHETQPFRTKWTSSVQNWGKITILRCPPQPFRTKWTSNVKNWGKIAILSGRAQPFRTKWTSSVKNWGKIAIFKFCGNIFARNGRRTSKTEVKLRLFFSNLNPSHEMDVESQKLR